MIRWIHGTLLSAAAAVLAGASLGGCVSGDIPAQQQANPDGSTVGDGGPGKDGTSGDGGAGEGSSSGASSGSSSGMSSGSSSGASSGGSSGASSGSSSGSSSGGSSGSSSGSSSGADGGGSACNPQTTFNKVATSDSDQHYFSGLAVHTATDLLIFSGYAGPDRSGDAAAGIVNQIDVQHFDPVTGAKKGPPSTVVTDTVVGSGNNYTGLQAAAVAPGGQIALVYFVEAYTVQRLDVVFLDPNLAILNTAVLEGQGGGTGYVQWENGAFVTSWQYGQGIAMKIRKFAADGSAAPGSGSVPTDDPNGHIWTNAENGTVAFSGNVFGVSYVSSPKVFSGPGYPMLAFIDTNGTPVRSPVALPYATSYPGAYVLTVGATAQGFVAVYLGDVTDSGTPSPLATFVSSSSSTLGAVGATYSIPPGPQYNSANAANAASDGLGGAGFAMLSNTGALNFVYITGDNSMSNNRVVESILQEKSGAPTGVDLVGITSFQNRFTLSLYSVNEHLTYAAVSGCGP